MGRLPNLATLSFLFLWVTLTSRPATATDPYAAQPRLFVQDGNLKLQAGKDKNITLLTSGAGKVFLNDENLVLLSNLARTASNQVESFRWTMQPLQEKVERLLQTVEGRDGLLRKIQGLDSGNASWTSPGSGSRKNLTTLSATVQRLERTLTRISANLRKNECRLRPCRKGSTCIDLYNKFKCLCLPGWEGPTCERDVDECAKLAHTELACQNGATCLNTPGSFVCLCTSGFFGMHCSLRNSSCASGSDRELCEHGSCRESGPGRTHECLCTEGWTHGEGGRCNKDVNECASRMPVCSVAPPVQCVNTPGSFECGPCPAGFTGNGMYCFDIDECLVNNGGCSMSPYVECINTLGYRKCGPCPPGFVGDGSTCRQGLTGCSVNNGDCHPLATCTETTDSYRSRIVCSCPAGMAGNGRGLLGCTSGISGDACAAQPCGVNGACRVRGPAMYECTCDTGFRGKNCEIPVIDEAVTCSPNPCQHGGSCSIRSPRGGVSCQCTEDYEGPFCADPVLSCGGTLAGHNGTLHSPGNTYAASSRSPLTCIWTLESGDGVRVLQLSFSKFYVHSKRGECLDSFIEIRDADLPSHSSSTLGHFCSPASQPSGPVTSYSPKVTITYTVTSSGASANEWSLNWTTVDAQCGASLHHLTSPGVLSSPGFPRPYSTGTACVWILSTIPGYRLEFTISEIKFERRKDDKNPWSSCEDIYANSNLKIHDGLMMYSPLLLSVCNSSLVPPVTTSGAEAHILFHSIAGQRTSFQIMYRPVPGVPGCGGTFTSPEGDITSRPLEGLNRDLLCEWTVHLPVNERLRLFFTRVEIRAPLCDSYLEVHNGRSDTLVEKFCDGASARAPLITEGNSIRIVYKMHYDAKKSTPSFTIHYESVCGGVFSAPSGTLASPYYPRAYPNARLCRYTIAQEPGRVIKLDLRYLDMTPPGEKDNACTYQSVKVYNGDTANHTLLGEYCGSKIPPTIISTRNILYIEYKTDGSQDHAGFQANYSSIDLGCGGIYTAPSGTISLSSPLQTASCEWILSAPPGNAVHINWITFSVRAEPTTSYWSFGEQCSKMYMTVHDNGTTPATLMDKLCGVETPHPMTSQGNVVTLTLVNHNFGANKGPGVQGFVLNYVTVNSTTLCGGNHFAPSGILTSPLYPSSYPPNRQCVWTIQVPQGQQVRLNFTSFRLESGWRANCGHTDYLEVRDGGYASSPLRGKYCGVSFPAELVSSSNRLYLKFVSDDNKNSFPGFQISWDAAATGCGGILNAPSGFLASPNYPYPYNYRATCYWRIYVAQGSAVSLMTLDINIDCYVPFRGGLEIYDGDSVHGKLIARYCGQPKWNTLIESQSNSMLIKYTSNLEDKGFHLTYSTSCNRTVSGYSGVIESINFPLPYEPQANCWWNISVPPGNQIELAFSEFQLERRSHLPRTTMDQILPLASYGNGFRGPFALARNRGCFDYVEIFDVVAESGWQDLHQVKPTPLLNRTCGKEKPPAVLTTHTSLAFIHFYSDYGTNAKGFRLEWNLKGCGGVFENRPYGTITSPNYGEHGQNKYYGHNLQCDWEIRADLDHSVEINILDIDLETNSECEMDSLIIYNGLNAEGTNLTKHLCMKSSTGPITVTASHEAFVRFVTDSSITGRGFKLNFKLVPSTCGGQYSGTSGVIHSKNYPRNYDVNDDCLFKISVPEGHLVKLTLEDFDLGACYSAGRKVPVSAVLNVYDGDSVDAPRLKMYCGNTVAPNATSLVSSGNTLLVHFKAGEYHPHKGFKASYSLACGARLVTDGSGTLSVNAADVLTTGGVNCSWTIVAKSPESRVSLAIQTRGMFPIYFRDYAGYTTDAFYVFDGDSSDAPLLVKSSLNQLPASVQGKSSSMHVVLQVPSEGSESFLHDKFFATYSVRNIACGGELKGDGGSFSSPNYPLQYPINADCVWTVKSTPGNKIAIQFSSFHLEEDEFCNEDFVEVRESSGSGKLLGVFCGARTPGNITVTSQFWIRFRSNGIGTASGFTADYSYVEDVEILGESSGEIASPQYPDPYLNTKTFSWYLRVGQNSRVRFKILDTFLEGRQDDCSYYGVLKVYEGNTPAESRLLHPDLCSAPRYTEFTSLTPEALVQFEASPMKRGSYFKLAWAAVGSGSGADDTTPAATRSSPFPYFKNARLVSLDLNLSAPTSFISYHSTELAPSVPMVQPLVYMVTAPPGYRVSALVNNFTVVNMLGSAKVHLYSGSSDPFHQTDIVKVDEITENPNVNASTAKTATSKNNKLYLVIDGSGYVVVSLNMTVRLACGGVITGLTSGTLVMNPTIANLTRFALNQPLSHLTILTCDWTIAARPRRRLKVTVLSSDMTPKTNGVNRECGSSYLQIRNGGSISSPRLGDEKFCSPVNLLSPSKKSNTTSSNLLFVRYKYSYNFIQSFTLAFEEAKVGCGGELTLAEGRAGRSWAVLTSPGYPEAPPSHVQCVWYVQAPAHRKLQVRFQEQDFDLDTSINCANEYVEVRDGSTQLSPSLGKFCHSPPALVKGTGTVLMLKYFTDIDEPKNGFSANVSLQTCGGSIEGIYGSQTLRVFYPQLTEPTCEWSLSTGAAAYLTLNVTRFDVNRVSMWSNCSAGNDDTLQVRVWDRMSRNQSLVFSECSPAAVPFYLRTDTNRLTVTYLKAGNRKGRVMLLSNGDLRRTGFSITVTAVPEPCGGTLTAPAGEISLPCVPAAGGGRTGGMERFCVWGLRAPADRRITVTPVSVQFSALNTVPDDDATFDGPEDAIGFFYSDITDTRYRRPFTLLTSPSSVDRRVDTSGGSVSIVARVRSHCPSGGFRLQYATDEPAFCGGTLASQGTLSSPNASLASFSCEWTKVAPPYQTFALTIVGTVSAQDSNRRCNSSSAFLSNTLILYNYQKQLIHRLCSTYDTPTTFLSPYPTTLIHAIKGRTYVNMWQSPPMQFNMSYRSYPCGGLLHSPANISISSNSSESVNCAWLVEYPDGDEIKVTASPRAGPCDSAPDDTAYFYIYNGPRPFSSPLMAKIHPCTLQGAVAHTSTSNILWIEYRGRDTTANGFNLNMEKVVLSCGDILSSPEGVIESPGYADRAYPANTECEWYIQVQDGFFISLHFADRFFIQDSVNCSSDYLQVFDWVNEEYKPLQRLCGRAATGEFNSTRNQMKLVFHSDSSVSGDGFRVRYRTHCGGIYNGSSQGVIMSPSYPNDYPVNLSCNYTFMDEERLISLNFSDFKLEPSAGCTFDRLTIVSSGANTLDSWMAELPATKTRTQYCGEVGPGFVTFVDWVSVLFDSDPYVSNRGFFLEYSLSKCGGHVSSQQRISVSPYKDVMHCSWTVTAPPKQLAVITIINYSKPYAYYYHKSCAQGVKFYDVLENGTHSGPVSTLCESTLKPYVFRALGNRTVLTLDSEDATMIGDSAYLLDFMVTFTYGPEVCKSPIALAANTTIHLTPAIISDIHHECERILSTETGNTLRISVVSLNIHATGCSGGILPLDWSTLGDRVKVVEASGCSCNRLEISWGSNTPLILCMMNQSQSPIYVDSSTVAVKFVQNTYLPGLTYDLEVTSQLPVCGVTTLTANSSSQVFSSPPVQPGLNCIWTVQWEGAPRNMRIQFSSLNLGRPDDTTCSESYVQLVQDGTVLGKFCGTSLPPVSYFPTLSADSSVKRSIEMRTGSVLSHPEQQGFRIEYQIVGCSRDYNNDQGNLVYMEQMAGECLVTLSNTVSSDPFNSIEALVFSQFELGTKDCLTNKLVVTDAVTKTHLATLCDTGLPLPIFPSSRQVSLHLYASGNTTARVSLTYVTSQCGLVLRDPRGALVSRNYPKALRSAESCSVTIVPPRPVTLKFRTFDLGDAKCSTNYLLIQVTEGPVVKYCGREVPAELEIKKQGATLTYVTTEGNDGQGWYLTYEPSPESYKYTSYRIVGPL